MWGAPERRVSAGAISNDFRKSVRPALVCSGPKSSTLPESDDPIMNDRAFGRSAFPVYAGGPSGRISVPDIDD